MEAFGFEQAQKEYTLQSFADLANSAGFDCSGQWTDAQALFSVHYLQRRP